jgi:hypothetical protein
MVGITASDASERELLVRALGVFDKEKYPRLSVQSAAQYRAAPAFPHISIPDFLPVDLAHAARAAFPGPHDIPWYTSEHGKARKRYQFEDRCLPPLLRAIVTSFTSSRFILFLEELTGIPSLRIWWGAACIWSALAVCLRSILTSTGTISCSFTAG